MAKSTTAQLRNKDHHITLSQQETDAPVLPMAQIERIKEIHPARVDWVFEETTLESRFRRAETRRVNTLVFIERLFSMVSGLVIGSTSLYTCYHLAMQGHDVVAGVVGGTTVVGLVSAFVIGVRRKAPAQ